MKNYLPYLSLFCIFITCSCHKNHETPIPVVPHTTDVYVFGNFQNLAPPYVANNRAIYYKDSIRYNIYNDTSNNYRLSCFAISNNIIYAGGSAGVTINGSAVYWKNGVSQFSAPGANSNISAIAVSGNDIYAGYESFSTSTYTQSSSLMLNGNTKFTYSGFATGITISDADVYVYGDTTNYIYGNPNSNIYTSATNSAIYFKNGVPVHLGNIADTTTISIVTSMCVSGNDVYAAGTVNDATGTHAVYWKNGVMNVLPVSPAPPGNIYNSYVSCIAVKGNDVYISGMIQSGDFPSSLKTYATLWKNGTPTTLSTNDKGSGTTNIVISGDDVYVGGIENGQSTIYWKNGKAVKIKGPFDTTEFGEVGIAVVTK